MENSALWSTTLQVAAIKSGKLTSRELLEIIIDRISRLNPAINAVITTDFDRARQRADDFDKAYKSGETGGLLSGIPVTIKDALETEGIRSTGGAKVLEENVPDRDAPVVRSIKEAGAIVIGKSNLPLWSGDIQAYNDMFCTTNNPWNPERVPGGSSGGAAAAVATGLTSFEIGTDIGGSIRFPSAFCGVFGHKPSYGVVPSTGYLDHELGGHTEADVNVIGPIARSAEDLRLLLNILKRDSGPLQAELSDPIPADKARIAAWLDDDFCRIDTEVLDKITETVDTMESAGLKIDRKARPEIDPREASGIGMQLVSAAISWIVPDAPLRHVEWLELHRKREMIRLKWAEFFKQYDVLLVPVCFVPPFQHLHEGDFMTRTLTCNGETRPYFELVSWTILIGMAFLPSTVPPIGLGKSGLPIGIQVVGPYGGELTTIGVAERISELMGDYQPPPMAL